MAGSERRPIVQADVVRRKTRNIRGAIEGFEAAVGAIDAQVVGDKADADVGLAVNHSGRAGIAMGRYSAVQVGARCDQRHVPAIHLARTGHQQLTDGDQVDIRLVIVQCAIDRQGGSRFQGHARWIGITLTAIPHVQKLRTIDGAAGANADRSRRSHVEMKISRSADIPNRAVEIDTRIEIRPIQEMGKRRHLSVGLDAYPAIGTTIRGIFVDLCKERSRRIDVRADRQSAGQSTVVAVQTDITGSRTDIRVAGIGLIDTVIGPNNHASAAAAVGGINVIEGNGIAPKIDVMETRAGNLGVQPPDAVERAVQIDSTFSTIRVGADAQVGSRDATSRILSDITALRRKIDPATRDHSIGADQTLAERYTSIHSIHGHFDRPTMGRPDSIGELI